MTERTTNCQIVDNAKVLAAERGLDASKVFCPYIRVCNGEVCAFALAKFKPVSPARCQTDKFYKRLEDHGTKTNS